MFIYKITNKINGKIYIGQTTRSIKKRWSEHCRKNSGCPVLSNSIKKYEKDNFKIEEIDGANSLSELNYLEDFYICKFNSLSPNGYNLKEGGANGSHTKDTVDKIRQASTGRLHSKESKEKMSKIATGRKQSKKHIENNRIAQTGRKPSQKTIEKMKNRHISEESKLKMSIGSGSKLFEAYKIIERNGKMGKVLKTKYIGSWINQSKCARDLELGVHTINKCLKKRLKTYRGYTFKYKKESNND